MTRYLLALAIVGALASRVGAQGATATPPPVTKTVTGAAQAPDPAELTKMLTELRLEIDQLKRNLPAAPTKPFKDTMKDICTGNGLTFVSVQIVAATGAATVTCK